MKTKFVKCVVCKAPFVQGVSTHKVCSVECSIENVKQQKEYKEKIAKKEWNERKKKIKEELMTITDWLDKAQKEFNKYIRIRDRGQLCISCNKPINGVKHASHYLSSGNYSKVRFNEDNVWVSCYKCNDKLSGNLLEYRKNLIKKIGSERVEWLENNGSENKDWTIEEVKHLISVYKQKSKGR